MAVSALVLLLSSQPARATVVKVLDVEALSRRAELVVRGTALDSSASWARGGKLIQTVTRVKIDRPIKGAATAEVVEVRTSGGTVGDISQRVSGSAQLAAGEEVMLFLKRIPGARPRFAVEGFAQGKFTLKRVDGSTLVTRELAGLSVLDSAGRIRPGPGFEPQPEAQFIERVRKALGETTVP